MPPTLIHYHAEHHFITEYYSMEWVYQFVYSFIYWRHLGCFQVLKIIIKLLETFISADFYVVLSFQNSS